METWYQKSIRVIDSEFTRLRQERPDWTIAQIMAEVRRFVQKPKHGGYYPYRQWAKACQDYREKAEKAYPSRV